MIQTYCTEPQHQMNVNPSASLGTANNNLFNQFCGLVPKDVILLKLFNQTRIRTNTRDRSKESEYLAYIYIYMYMCTHQLPMSAREESQRACPSCRGLPRRSPLHSNHFLLGLLRRQEARQRERERERERERAGWERDSGGRGGGRVKGGGIGERERVLLSRRVHIVVCGWVDVRMCV